MSRMELMDPDILKHNGFHPGKIGHQSMCSALANHDFEFLVAVVDDFVADDVLHGNHKL